MKHVFIVNALARDGECGRYWQSIEPTFRDVLGDIEVLTPDTPERCQQAAKEKADRGGYCIVAVGGEGSMNRVMNGIMASGNMENTAMGLVPFGNVNDYAANIGLEKTWQHALEVLKQGHESRVGVIRMTADDVCEYAMNIADIGFGASTAKRHSVDHQLSWIRGRLKYNLLALMELFRWRNIPATVTVDGERLNGKVGILLGGFSPTLGGFELAPGAHADADRMTVTIGMNVTKPEILGLMGDAKNKRLKPSEKLLFRQALNVVIDAEAAMVAEVDGEIIHSSARRVELQAEPACLRFMVPKPQ